MHIALRVYEEVGSVGKGTVVFSDCFTSRSKYLLRYMGAFRWRIVLGQTKPETVSLYGI